MPAAAAEAARRGEIPANTPVLDPNAEPQSDDVQISRKQKRDEIYDTCGVAFVELRARGGRRADHHTGFILGTKMASAIEYGWLVKISDTGGTSYRPFNGGLAFRRNWLSPVEDLGLSAGVADAKIVVGRSWALLADGTICTAGGANAWDYIN